MTAPVPVYKNKVVFGTRRTESGYYRIPPIPEIRNAICFIVLHCAAVHQIEIWALVIMSNHIHWIGLDRLGRYPAFIRDVHMRIQEVISHHHGIPGRLWSGDRPRTPRLEGTELDTILYAVTNPAKDNIEHVSTNWPGLIFSPENAGDTISATCPQILQETYNSFPKSISYVVPVPRFYSHLSIKEVRRDFARRRRAREAYLIAKHQGPALGAATALAVGPYDRPDDPVSREPFRCFHATAEREQDCLEDLDSFRRRYGSRRRSFNAGDRDVVWPIGTYARHHWHGCPRAARAP